MSVIPLANLTAAQIVALSAASASGNSPDLSNRFGSGVQITVDITALTGTTPTLTVNIQTKDPISGKYVTLLSSAALSATGTTLLTIYPGLTNAANTVASQVLPRDWRVSYTIAGTTPAVTATIAASILA
jgi:hypothetical protein